VTLIVIWTKFSEGAWLVTVAIPVLVVAMLGIRRHYARVGRRLRAGAAAVASAPPATNRTLLVVEAIDPASMRALQVARTISPDGLRAVHVPRRGSDPGIRPRWFHAAGGDPILETLDTSAGGVEAVLEQVWRLPRGESDFVTVVVPELFRRRSLLDQARRPFELALKLRLLSEPGAVVVDVPTVPGDEGEARDLAVRVFVPGAGAASMRAVNWAQTLDIADTRAVNFTVDHERADRLRFEWAASGPRIPLDVHEAPYRDLGEPVLAYLRALTEEQGREVLAVMPELVLRGWSRILHNQRALYLKRLLLVEPHVILASVPYQLLR